MPRYQQPRNVVVSTVASLLTDISSEMVVHLLPLFLAQVLRTSTPFIGLIEGAGESAASLLKLVSGRLSDRFRTRKTPVVLGYGLSTLAKAFLVSAGSWGVVFAARLSDRVGKGIRTAPRDALIADSVPETRRGAAFGFHRAGDTLGAFLGVGIAWWLVRNSGDGATLSRATFHTVALWSLVPAGAAVLVLLFGLREPPRPAAPARDRPAPRSLGTLPPRPLRGFLLVLLLFTFGASADAFLILRARERGADLATTLLMVLGFNLVYALAAQPLGRLSDRIGRKPLLLIGWGIYAASYAGLALATSVTAVGLIWAGYALYYAASEGTARALVADLVPPELRGTAYGWYHLAVGLGSLPASLIAGWLWARVSPAAAFGFGALAAGLATVALAVLPIPRRAVN